MGGRLPQQRHEIHSPPRVTCPSMQHARCLPCASPDPISCSLPCGSLPQRISRPVNNLARGIGFCPTASRSKQCEYPLTSQRTHVSDGSSALQAERREGRISNTKHTTPCAPQPPRLLDLADQLKLEGSERHVLGGEDGMAQGKEYHGDMPEFAYSRSVWRPVWGAFTLVARRR
eukprot:763005-Hanusia_phi.AAC.3